MSDRRNEILLVAKQLFADRGVHATTVREIGGQAGILSGSLYHHFASKHDMVDAILGPWCAEIMRRYESIIGSGADAVTRLTEMTHYAFSLIAEDAAGLVMFYNEGPRLASQERFTYLAHFDRRLEEQWAGVLADGVNEGSLRADIDPVLFYRVVRDTVAGAARWYRPSKSLTLQQMADAFVDLVLHGLVVRDGAGGR
jgi:AcrR family transcriptional regulator